MIELYKATNTNFTANGDLILDQVVSECTLSAELNGSWAIELTAQIDDSGAALEIEANDVIKVPTFMTDSEQLYRVNEPERSDTQVTATLYPIFYDAKSEVFLLDVRPTDKNGQETLDIMLASNSKYSAVSDITTTDTAYYVRKNFYEALNGDDDNSFINRWGGEILYNNFQIIVNSRAGGDYGVAVEYGKNISAITETTSLTDLATRIVPVAYGGYMLNGSEPWVDSDLIGSYPVVYTKEKTYSDIKLVDADSDEEGYTNMDDLRTALREAAEAEYSDNQVDRPIVTLDIDIVQLSETEAYKDYKDLETIRLGDTVHCKHKKLGIESDARCTKIEYDCLSKRVTALTLGKYTSSYFNDVSGALNAVSGAIRSDGTLIAEKITGIINGVNAQLSLQSTVAQKIDGRAFLIEDLDPDSGLYGAMEAGTQGLRIAKTRTADAQAWDWKTAITAAGMIADVIIAGILADQTGKSYWNLDTGELQLSGIFKQYDANGYQSLELNRNALRLFDWKDSGNFVGSIGATQDDATGRKGITIAADVGDKLSFGYFDGTTETHIQVVLSIDGSTGKLTISNTASGKLFPNNPGGGVVIDSGLVKSWSLNSYTGTVTVSGLALNFKDGLLISVG